MWVTSLAVTAAVQWRTVRSHPGTAGLDTGQQMSLTAVRADNHIGIEGSDGSGRSAVPEAGIASSSS